MLSGDLVAAKIRAALDLTRPIIVFDFETTGTRPEEDRAVSMSLIKVTPDASGDKQWSTLIRPGIPIPPDSTKTHGITDAMVHVCRTCGHGYHVPLAALPDLASPGMFIEAHEYAPRWPRFADLAESLIRGFTGVDLAGKNIRRFDVPLFRAECTRAGFTWDIGDAKMIDVDRLWQIGEPRTLADAVAYFCGETMEGAHDATIDTEWTGSVIAAQLTKFAAVLPRDVAALDALQWPGAIDPDGKFRFIDGVPCIDFGKKYPRGTPMANIEPGFYKWILRDKGFSPIVKRIAADVLKGIYPVAPSTLVAAETA